MGWSLGIDPCTIMSPHPLVQSPIHSGDVRVSVIRSLRISISNSSRSVLLWNYTSLLRMQVRISVDWLAAQN